VHHLLAGSGAVFGSKMGWERPNVFAPPGVPPVLHYSWDKPDWLAWSAAEQAATRDAVAVFDQTSFGKILVKGRDAERLLQWLCTADVAVAPGRVVYTGLLNRRGGYEADVTITRVAHDEFLLVTGSASIERDLAWIRQHTPDDAHVVAVDVTSSYAVFGVMGPRSRDLLQGLTRTDLSHEAFPFATSALIDLGYSTVRATRITYVGELGWELYVPTEFAVGVYELLADTGRTHGLTPAGYYAITSLRLEKGYRAFGADIGPDENPVEAGLLFANKLATDLPFLGREAVEQVKAAGPRRRLASLVLTDPEPLLWGGELVLRDGLAVGQVRSAAWGQALGASVAIAMIGRRDGDPVTPDYLRSGDYTVDVAGAIHPARLSLRPPFDPEGARITR
jgi:glycine cleavage system aminomethyltransferase T